MPRRSASSCQQLTSLGVQVSGGYWRLRVQAGCPQGSDGQIGVALDRETGDDEHSAHANVLTPTVLGDDR